MLNSILDSLDANISLLDDQGTILLVNRGWRQFAESNGISSHLVSEGVNYLDVCVRATGDDAIDASKFAMGIRRVLSGDLSSFSMDYACHSPTEKRWFRGLVTPLVGEGPKGAVVIHFNITERVIMENTFQSSQNNLEAAFSNIAYPIVVANKGIHRMVNSAAALLFGYARPDELIGKPVAHIIAPQEQMKILEIVMRRSRGESAPDHFQTKALKKDGTQFDMDVVTTTYRIGDEIYTLAALRDITEDNRLLQAEREQHEFTDALSRSTTVMNQLSDVATLLEKVVDLIQQVIPYDAVIVGDVLNDGTTFNPRLIRDFNPIILDILKVHYIRLDNRVISAQSEDLRSPVVFNYPDPENPIQDGLSRYTTPHSCMIIPIIVQDELVARFYLIKDQSHFYTQRHIERMVILSSSVSIAYLNARLFERQRELLQQVVSAQEEERRRVARELHDETGQALTAVIMNLQLLREEIKNAPELLKQVERIVEVAHSTANQIRNIAYTLRPPLIDTLGLKLAMEDHCNDIARYSKIAISFFGDAVSDISDATNIGLFRIFQEALTNSVRHSEATQIQVTLSATITHVTICISDNGKGFDVSHYLSSTNGNQGLGLLGMRERAKLLNGKLDIRTSLGTGTTICIKVPKEGSR